MTKSVRLADTGQEYGLYNKDRLVCSFTLGTDSDALSKVKHIYESDTLGEILQVKEPGFNPVLQERFNAFLKSRRFYKHRDGARRLIDAWGMSGSHEYFSLGHGLSLIDSLWVKRMDTSETWEDVNLYIHPFDEDVAYTAFEEGQSIAKRNGLCPTIPKEYTLNPEFGTNGTLPKCCRRENGAIRLYKGGIEWDWKGSIELLMEWYACQVATAMGLRHVNYEVDTYRGHLVSVCDAFTTDAYGYRHIADYLAEDSVLSDIVHVYERYGLQCELYDMFLFDAVICNTDKHTGNFGFTIDNSTYRPITTAPLFDNGYSLGGRVSVSKTLPGSETEQFIAAQNECGSALGIPFLDMAQGIMTQRRVEMLRRIEHFEFKEHPKYTMKYPSIRNMNALVQHQVQALLRTESETI